MKIRHLDLDDQRINPEHQALGLPPVEYEVTHAAEHPVLKLAAYLVLAVLTGLVLYLLWRLFHSDNQPGGLALVQQSLQDPMFWSAVAVGLLAQTIDPIFLS